ncbi:MAG: AMP-binding protein [Thermoanaerobaculia bacterium]
MPESVSRLSLPARLRDLARVFPDRVALREKEYGLWQEITYAGYWRGVATAGMALRELGVEAGDRVAIHSENRAAWVWTDLGAQGVHAASVGLYPTNPPAEVEYLLGHSEAKVLVAEDQEQVDKALAVADRLPALKTIVYVEPRGVRGYDDPRLLAWDDFLELGRRALATDPVRFDELVSAIDRETTATLVYTSGTTGPPKGAMLSHRNIMWAQERVTAVLEVEALPERVELLSYLPLCHVFEKLFTLQLGLELGAAVSFAESIDTVTHDLAEVQPTFFPAPPRIWEKMQAGVMVRMSDASAVKRWLFDLCLRAGRWNADRVLAHGRRGLLGDAVYAVGWVLVYRALKRKLGLRHTIFALSGAAPIAPEVLRFFMALGVPIYEGYGMTENTAYATCSRPRLTRLGTVGTPNPGAEVRLADDGEILVRHDAVFKGYFRDDAATAAAIDQDGWLHTGDVGAWDGDYLRIVDRKKDIVITSGGKNVSPSEIENKLKFSPYVKEAVVVGDGRKFISALIGIELDTVSHWATKRGLAFTTYRDLSEKQETVALVQTEVDRVNGELARVEQIKRFRLIPKELDHEQGELTATQKVKRRYVEDLFRDLIEEIYR